MAKKIIGMALLLFGVYLIVPPLPEPGPHLPSRMDAAHILATAVMVEPPEQKKAAPVRLPPVGATQAIPASVTSEVQ